MLALARSAVAAGLALALAGPVAAQRPSGELVALPGRSACLAEGMDFRRCANTRLGQIADVAISPNGRHLYVASYSTIWTFTRDISSGVLRRVRGRAGCV